MLYLRVVAADLGQVNNVFLLVAITALMAIATTVLAFLADVLPSAISGNATQTAADTLAGVTLADSGS